MILEKEGFVLFGMSLELDIKCLFGECLSVESIGRFSALIS